MKHIRFDDIVRKKPPVHLTTNLLSECTDKLKNCILTERFELYADILAFYNITEDDYIWLAYDLRAYLLLILIRQNNPQVFKLLECSDLFHNAELFSILTSPRPFIYDVLEKERLDKLFSDFTKSEPFFNYVALRNNLGVYPFSLHSKKDTPEPFLSLKKLTLKKSNARCFFTKKQLSKGEEVYEARFLINDYSTEFISKEAFLLFPQLAESRRRYEQDAYTLSEFMYMKFDNPFINYLFSDLTSFTVTKALDIVMYSYVAPTPQKWVSIDEGEKSIQEHSERFIYEGIGGELMTLLWILMKCGYVYDITKKLPAYPDDLAITLLAFNRPELQKNILRYLNLEKLFDIYRYTYSSNISVLKISQIAKFGQQYPHFLEFLARSLTRFEYHLYSNYNPTSNWYIADFEYFEGAKGGQLLYFFISNPTVFPVINKMLTIKKLPYSISAGGWDAYHNSCMYFYAVVYYYLKVNGSASLSCWQNESLVTPYFPIKSFYIRVIKNAEKIQL